MRVSVRLWSENVIELLKTLKLKFEDDKLAGTKAETNAVNAYSLSKRARDNAEKAATKSKKQKTTELATTDSDLVLLGVAQLNRILVSAF
jgi:hypothetical protein